MSLSFKLKNVLLTVYEHWYLLPASVREPVVHLLTTHSNLLNDFVLLFRCWFQSDTADPVLQDVEASLTAELATCKSPEE